CVFANKGAKGFEVFALMIVIPISILRINIASMQLINTIEPIKPFAYMACIFDITKMLFFINHMIIITICNNYIWDTKHIGKVTIWCKICRVYVANHYTQTIEVVSFGF